MTTHTVNVLECVEGLPKSDLAETLLAIATAFPQFDVKQYDNEQLCDIFARMLQAKQAIDQAYQSYFGTDPKTLPEYADMPWANIGFENGFDPNCKKCGRLIDGCYGGCLACDQDDLD